VKISAASSSAPCARGHLSGSDVEPLILEGEIAADP
jgi:hypothetical protein